MQDGDNKKTHKIKKRESQSNKTLKSAILDHCINNAKVIRTETNKFKWIKEAAETWRKKNINRDEEACALSPPWDALLRRPPLDKRGRGYSD